jgi:nucleoside-diphosphate-sugar epimerase
MRLLVTGAAGFVGSHVCEQALADGHEVVGVDAFIPYYPRDIKERNLAALRAYPRFTLHELDLRSGDLTAALDGVTHVVHEAAMPGLPRSWSDFELYMTCNLLGTQRLLEAARAAAIQRFLHVSTSSVYGSEAVGDETMPTRPTSPYGVTKLAAEQLVLAWTRAFDFPATIVRYFSIYGPRQRPDMAYNVFTRAMLTGAPITVFGDGEQTRSNTFISDCVRGTLQALSGGAPGEVYNIGGGAVVTLNRAIEIIAKAAGVTPRIERGAPRLGDQRHTAADTSKARAAFGYEPHVLPEEGLRRQVEWQRAQLHEHA